MRIFISWSGSSSLAVANVLAEWLPNVLQSVSVFFSPDINKGERGLNSIAEELEASSFGIICLTKENVTSPWINFEAGALSKKLDEGRVAPVLHNMAFRDIPANTPLTQFQATICESKDDFFKLLKSINTVTTTPLEESKLSNAFEKWWPDLEGQLAKTPTEVKPINTKETDLHKNNTNEKVLSVLDEILSLVRQQTNFIKTVESQPTPKDDSSSIWTDKRIDQLAFLWRRGVSASEIAAILGGGITRNAVIGKAHRMGLSGRPSPIKKVAVNAEKADIAQLEQDEE